MTVQHQSGNIATPPGKPETQWGTPAPAASRPAGHETMFPDKAPARSASRPLPKPSGRRRIRKHEVLMFTSQLAIMCESGVDLAGALEETAAHCSHPRFQAVLKSVYHDVANGVPFSAALRRHEHVFGGAYIGSVAAAESSGNMAAVLRRLAGFLRNEIRLRSSLISIFSYPVALATIASLVILALVFFVLPQFGKVFENMHKTPPPFTQFLLEASAFARNHGLLLLGAAALAAAGLYHFARSGRAARYWDRFILEVALFRTASRALMTGRSFRLLGTMVESGVPLLESVRLCRTSVRNIYFRQLFSAMEKDVLNGVGIGPAVAAAFFIPPGVAQMVATAEKTGKLGSVLGLIGEFYEEDGERQVQQVVKLLEPLIIVVMGGIVAVVVASVMLPLLNVTTMSS